MNEYNGINKDNKIRKMNENEGNKQINFKISNKTLRRQLN